MFLNLFEILILFSLLGASVFTIKKYGIPLLEKRRDRDRRIEEGIRRRFLVEKSVGSRCVFCAELGADIYDEKHGWVHQECYKEII